MNIELQKPMRDAHLDVFMCRAARRDDHVETVLYLDGNYTRFVCDGALDDAAAIRNLVDQAKQQSRARRARKLTVALPSVASR